MNNNVALPPQPPPKSKNSNHQKDDSCHQQSFAMNMSDTADDPVKTGNVLSVAKSFSVVATTPAASSSLFRTTWRREHASVTSTTTTMTKTCPKKKQSGLHHSSSNHDEIPAPSFPSDKPSAAITNDNDNVQQTQPTSRLSTNKDNSSKHNSLFHNIDNAGLSLKPAAVKASAKIDEISSLVASLLATWHAPT
jgi:hypothetical protein